MKFSYCSLILLLFTQFTHADTTQANDLCLQIKRDKDQPDLCRKIGDRFPNNRRIMTDNCIYVKNAFITSYENADENCTRTFGALSTMQQSRSRAYVAPTSAQTNADAATDESVAHAATVDTTARASAEMLQCQPKPFSAYSCNFALPIGIPNLSDMISIQNFLPAETKKDPKYTDEACNCFKKQSEESIAKKGANALERQIGREQKKINDLVFQAAGVRILNSFTSNLEDIKFYRANNTALIGGDAAAEKLECNNVSQYRQKVLRACNINHVDPKVMEQRMSDILSSLGDSKRDRTLEDKFATIQNQALGLNLEKNVNGQTGSFTRTRYDQIRFGAAKGLPEVNFLNEVTDALMDHEVLGPELEHAMKIEGHTPGRAIFSMIKKESRPEVKELLLKLAKDPKNNGDFSKEMIAVLETPNTADLEMLLDEKITKTMEMHPSLKALFKSSDLFYQVREASHRSGTHSLLAQMENNPSYLKEYYEDRCEKIQDQFAEAACAPDDNFINLTNREDLNSLLSPFEKDINPNLKDLIICRIPRAQDTGSVFQKLAFKKWDRIGESDYWRSKKPGQTEGTFLADVQAMVRSGDREALGYLGGLSKMGDNYRAPDKAYVASKLKDDGFSFLGSAPENGRTIASVPEAATESTREYAGVKVLSQLSETLGGTDTQIPYAPGMADYTAPAPLPPVENRERRDRFTKSALRDFLADNENADEIEKHLAQTKSADHEELLKLREELAKNKEMLMNLSVQTEQNKLKALQERYKALENDSLRNPVVAQARAQEDSETRNENRSSIVAGNNSVASNNPGDVIGSNNIAPSAQTSGSESGTGSSSRNPSAVSNARLSAAGGGAEGNFAFSSSSPQGEILIEQSSTFTPGQQLAPEDLSLVIKKYVEQTELDVQTLKQLKDQEVVIKYKVFEDGVEVLKTMTVKSDTLSPETKRFLESQIALKEKEVERNEARRAHSFATLKLLLGIKAKSVY